MIAAKPLTCADLWTCPSQTGAAFRAFIEAWVKDRRCPYPFGDWLEDLGLTRAADCARWMHEGEGWESWEFGGTSGRLPWGAVGSRAYAVWRVSGGADDGILRAHWLPRGSIGSTTELTAPTVPECLVKVLDVWVPEAERNTNDRNEM